MKTVLMMIAMMAASSSMSFAQVGGAGLANPASVLCAQKGGKVQIVDTRDGQVGVCALDRGLIEEWTLLRELSGTKSTAVKKLVKGANKDGLFPGNPASLYCKRLGGKSIVVDTHEGQYSLCQFKDKSTIEEWTLFRGAKDSLNQKLVSVLGI
jgi:putative hemolysin